MRNAPTNSSSESNRKQYARDGFVGPFRILDHDECQQTLESLEITPRPSPWAKDLAATSWRVFQLGARPEIIDQVAELIGEDVILWGAAVVRREPGRIHPFHTDLEAAGETGRSLSVWVGLQNTNRQSSLQLIAGSHQFGCTFQQVAFEAGCHRGEASQEQVLLWARQRNSASQIVQLDMTDGDAVFFDGQLWHASHNTNRSGTRTALLLQYATPDTPIRAWDPQHLSWPVRYRQDIKPRCIVVRGCDRFGVNNIVEAPQKHDGHRPLLESYVKDLRLPLGVNEATGFRAYPIARGATPCMDHYTNHVSALSPGKMPHAPHAHREEELLVMLAGEADLIFADPQNPQDEVRRRVRPGALVYYRANHRHTLQAAGSQPANYLMFKWHGKAATRELTPMDTKVYEFTLLDGQEQPTGDRPIQYDRLFEGPTRFLDKLHCHVTTVGPGARYAPHRDPYDVAIVVLHGTIEVLGQRVAPHGVIFCRAGEPHGMANVGQTPAQYLVFEFHGHDFRPSIPERLGFAIDHWKTRLRRLLRLPRRVIRKVRGMGVSVFR